MFNSWEECLYAKFQKPYLVAKHLWNVLCFYINKKRNIFVYYVNTMCLQFLILRFFVLLNKLVGLIS